MSRKAVVDTMMNTIKYGRDEYQKNCGNKWLQQASKWSYMKFLGVHSCDERTALK